MFNTPLLKPCKTRAEFYSPCMDQICYKLPYKYNLRLTTNNMVDFNEIDLQKCKIEMNLLYKNMEVVEKKEDDGKAPIMINSKVKYNKKAKSLDCGPFYYNICSYKHDGRSFRLQVILLDEMTGQRLCQYVSPAFPIKAKKPIANPGIKKNLGKRKRVEQSPPLSPATDNMCPIQMNSEEKQTLPHSVVHPLFVAMQQQKRRKITRSPDTPMFLKLSTPNQMFPTEPLLTFEQENNKRLTNASPIWNLSEAQFPSNPFTNMYLAEQQMYSKPQQQMQTFSPVDLQENSNPFADFDSFLNPTGFSM